jgi:hypothetical protein
MSSGIHSSVSKERFWWPLDLSPRAENAFLLFRSQMGQREVSVDTALVDSTAASLAQVMSRHYLKLIQRDSLPHLSHILNGWGDFSVNGSPLSTRIERFIHRDDRGRHFLLQCDPEGEFHPWQTLAYVVMAGVDPELSLGSSGATIRDLALNSRQLNTKEGRELGHLLFGLAYLDPEMAGGPFFLEDIACDLPKLVELAVEAHHYGTFEVCRKFHLTEGLCAVAAKIAGFEKYRDDAQGFLEGQLDILLVLGTILQKASELRAANKEMEPDSLIHELRDVLVLGPFLENHCYYAGHIIELAAFASSFGYRIAPEHRSAISFVINELNQTLPLYLSRAQFEQCFLHLGHYRRAITLYAAMEQDQSHGRALRRDELRRFTTDIESLSRESETAFDHDTNPSPAIYELVYEPTNRREGFEQIIAEYEKIAPRHFEARGTAGHYRRMGPVWWPRALHYEFVDYGGIVGAEIHLESDDVRPLGDLVHSLVDQASNSFPTLRVQWEPSWSLGRGRLLVLFPPELPAGVVAAGMVTLIDETFSIIDAAMRKRPQLSQLIGRNQDL